MFLQSYYTIVYAISLTMIMFGFRRNQRENRRKEKKFLRIFRYILSFTSIAFIGRLTLPLESFVMILFVPDLWICFFEKKRKLEVLGRALNAVLFLFLTIVLLGSPVLFWHAEAKDTVKFQVSMGFVVIILSCLYGVYLRNSVNRSIKNVKASWCIVIVKGLILCFFAVVIPQFKIDDPKLFYLSQWCFAVLLLFVVFLLRLYSRLERSYMLLQLDRKRQKEIEKEYKNMIGLKHYLIHLVEGFLPYFKKSDIIGAMAYFERYISPIHEEYLKTDDIQNIKNVPISSIIENAINQSIHNDIHFDYYIFGIIEIEESMEMDVFRILSEWVSNAIESLQKQSKGRLHIEMKSKERCTSFTVSNSVYPVVVDRKRRSEKGRGYGLAIGENIIIQNRRLTSTHEIRNGYYHHCLLVHRK